MCIWFYQVNYDESVWFLFVAFEGVQEILISYLFIYLCFLCATNVGLFIRILNFLIWRVKTSREWEKKNNFFFLLKNYCICNSIINVISSILIRDNCDAIRHCVYMFYFDTCVFVFRSSMFLMLLLHTRGLVDRERTRNQ